MKVLIALTCVVVLASASTFDDERQRIIAHVNSLNTTWTAGENGRFSSYDDLKIQCGVLPGGPKLEEIPITNKIAVPESFDARTEWGSICPSLHEVRDQSACGSCWAHGAVEVATDRICIASKGAKQHHFSVEDLNSCCHTCGGGCGGGYPAAAMQWFVSSGGVSGGNYGHFDLCYSYSLMNCDHHTTGRYRPCAGLDFKTPACHSACDRNTTYKTAYGADKTKFSRSYSVPNHEETIQTDIMTYGSVEASFTVYADFEAYKSGIYHHVTGAHVGGHAVKMIGWGIENGVKYWLMVNSWNEDWGEKGFFRIQRGNNECGIEGGIVAAHP
jgi:cathepsin B